MLDLVGGVAWGVLLLLDRVELLVQRVLTVMDRDAEEGRSVVLG